MLCYNQSMNSTTAQQLIDLNRRFYAEFGAQFSATRQRIQPGVRKFILQLVGAEQILDLGCGNGELARALAQNGFQGTYLGLDFSLPLLNAAMSQPKGLSANFRAADLTTLDWDQALTPARFSIVTAFAVLHHIPDANLHRRILMKVYDLLEPGGKFILSSWQFLNSEKLKHRIQAWDVAGLTPTEVDDGDYLLDWRSGGSGLRYVHHFSPLALDKLAAETGFQVQESFFSDGEGGRLGLYQVWERHENKR
jgi:2-polyprenyl-3-methyl-5-hydroxy-6-metoxy-1,4-benzoquinol methylase